MYRGPPGMLTDDGRGLSSRPHCCVSQGCGIPLRRGSSTHDVSSTMVAAFLIRPVASHVSQLGGFPSGAVSLYTAPLLAEEAFRATLPTTVTTLLVRMAPPRPAIKFAAFGRKI